MSLEKRIKMIKMSQSMSQCEITNNLGILKHAVKVIQKMHADVGSILDLKMTNSRLLKFYQKSKIASKVINIHLKINNSLSNG